MRRTLDPSRAPRLREVLEPGRYFFNFLSLLLFFSFHDAVSSRRSRGRGAPRGIARQSRSALATCVAASHGAATSGRARAGRARAAGARRRVALGDGATATSKAAAAAESPHLGMRYASPAASPLRPRYQREPTRTHSLSHFVSPSPSPFFLTLLLPHSHFFTPSSLSLPHSLFTFFSLPLTSSLPLPLCQRSVACVRPGHSHARPGA